MKSVAEEDDSDEDDEQASKVEVTNQQPQEDNQQSFRGRNEADTKVQNKKDISADDDEDDYSADEAQYDSV